jgi:hypothetical protein
MHIAHTSRSGDDDRFEKNGDPPLLPFDDDLGDTLVFPIPPGICSKGGDIRALVLNCDKFCGVWNDNEGEVENEAAVLASFSSVVVVPGVVSALFVFIINFCADSNSPFFPRREGVKDEDANKSSNSSCEFGREWSASSTANNDDDSDAFVVIATVVVSSSAVIFMKRNFEFLSLFQSGLKSSKRTQNVVCSRYGSTLRFY